MKTLNMNRIVSTLVVAAILLTGITACTDPALSPEEAKSKTASPAQFGDQYAISASETFESGTKTSYTTGNVTLSTGSWNLNDALIGNSTSDRKNGTKSARVRNTGKVTMNFNVTNGISTVTVKHAKYGSDGNSNWELWYSTTSGSSWTKAGSTVTTSSTSLSTATFTVNVTGSARIEIRKTSGGSYRINFDDIVINDNGGGTPPPPPPAGNNETESNNTTGTANNIASFPTTINGTMSSTSDVDYFKFSVTSGQSISLSMTVPSGKDYDLYLLNPSASTVKSSEAGTGASESISYTATVTGTHYAKVISYSGSSTTLTYALTVNVTGGGTPPPPPSGSVHLTMGNPSGAVTSTSYPTNYLMEKAQYALSYHRDRAIPNWVAWHLDNTWLGSASRQDDFRADNTLPSGWYQVGSSSYSGSGFDRGHMCPSADRTKSTSDNSATFLMTNMIPQAPNNNQGPWASMENDLRALVTSGNELYIYSGGYGTQKTIDNGRIAVPTNTWKVVVVLPNGSNDLSRVTTTTRVITVDMTNYDGSISRSASWKTFRTTVDAVESKTGLDLLNAVSTSIQSVIESKVDNL